MTPKAIRTFYKLSFNRVDRNLRWVHFVSAPWINESGAEITLYVVFADSARKIDELSLCSTDGIELDIKTEKITNLPVELDKFNQLPEAFKNFYKVTFSLSEPTIVIGKGQIKSETVPLFTLMPKIEYPDFLFNIVSQAELHFPHTMFSTLVETGTLYGHTAIHASRLFDKVFTIELDNQLHTSALNINERVKNIEFIHGDSGEEVDRLVDRLAGPAVFFLDAHWSGDNTVDWSASKFQGFPTETSHLGQSSKKLPGSTEQVPLDKEINAILDRFSHQALIIIDDWQSVGNKDYAFAGEDWTHLSKQKLIDQFKSHYRTKFHYAYDEKHYVVGLDKMAHA